LSILERLGLVALHRFDPEQAHGLALKALRSGVLPLPGPLSSERLRTNIAGLDLPNPVGLAAGFDKNATALKGLARVGFGFVEVGAATPRPQPGNAKPRLFRLSEDAAVINRFGFNNDGAEAIAARLAQRPKGMVFGLNLGANKDSTDRAQDFAKVLKISGAHVDRDRKCLVTQHRKAAGFARGRRPFGASGRCDGRPIRAGPPDSDFPEARARPIIR
jgi:dihydroorotate dehydrogenase